MTHEEFCAFFIDIIPWYVWYQDMNVCRFTKLFYKAAEITSPL